MTTELLFKVDQLRGERLDTLIMGLDEHVHDVKSKEATWINNTGVAEQVSCLVEALGEREAREIIGNILEEEW